MCENKINSIPASIHIYSDVGKLLFSTDISLEIPPACTIYAVQYDEDGHMISMFSGDIKDKPPHETPDIKFSVTLRSPAKMLKLTLFDAENMVPISETQIRL